jgi:hypothetical protein
MNQLLEYAVQYAKLGWHVFPCLPGRKEPFGALVPRGVKNATKDENQIREWWEKQPQANVALACGQASGIYVCDIDVSDIVSGWESISKAVKDGNHLPQTVMQRTPTGGAHLLFVTNEPPRNHNSKGPDDPFFPGVDIRSDGYYIILAPSIHPCGGTYVWEPKHSPWEFTAALWPDWLRPQKNTPEPRTTILERPVDTGLLLDVIRRAERYLVSMPPAIEGQGGHSKLLTAAVRMVQGYLLTEDQAFDVLARVYNPRCVPPWDLSNPKELKDFRRKITEAMKLTPNEQPGWLLHASDYAPLDTSGNMSDAETQALIDNSMNPKIPPPIDDPPAEHSFEGVMHKSKDWDFITKPTGLLGDLCSWMNATSMRPQPLISLGCALAFCGTLFGRKIKTPCGLRTNLYCMGIGNTSSGKNHAQDLILKLAVKSCCFDELMGGDDFASDASIESHLERHPATLFILDEVGHLISHAVSGGNHHLYKIVPLLMKLYSSARSVYRGRSYAEDDKQRTLHQPCLSIWGTTTPKEFIRGLTTSDIESGWLSRCLIFRTDSIPPKVRGQVESEPPEELAALVFQWFKRKVPIPCEYKAIIEQREGENISLPPPQLIVPITTKADRVFQDFDNSARMEAKRNVDFCGLWLKAEENAKKIALVVAASEEYESPIITASVADYACRLIRFLLVDFCAYTGNLIYDSPLDAKKRKILDLIRQAGINGLAKNKLTRKTQRLCNGRERDAILEDLMEAEEIYRAFHGKLALFRSHAFQTLHMQREGA